MDFSSRRGEAQSLVKEANKLANPSFLGMRLKGDWLGATPLYERAALLFRVRCPPGLSLYILYHIALPISDPSRICVASYQHLCTVVANRRY